MFNDLRQMYRAWRVLRKAKRAYARGIEEGETRMPVDMGKWTLWGAALVGIGGVIVEIGEVLQGNGSLWDKVPAIVEQVGYVIAIIGGRRAVGKLIAKAN